MERRAHQMATVWLANVRPTSKGNIVTKVLELGSGLWTYTLRSWRDIAGEYCCISAAEPREDYLEVNSRIRRQESTARITIQPATQASGHGVVDRSVRLDPNCPFSFQDFSLK